MLRRRGRGTDCKGNGSFVLVVVASALVLSGCLGSAPTSTDGDGPDALGAVPSSFRRVGPDDPGLSIRDEDDRTLYTISDEDLDYRDATVAYALRANESLRFGVQTERALDADAWPTDGWMRHGAVLHSVPVDAVWGSSPPGERLGASMVNLHWTFVSQSSVRLHAAIDGQTVVSVAQEQPLPPPLNSGTTAGSLDPDTNLSRGEWIVVYLGGASPRLGEETKVAHTIAATASFDVFRLPDRELRWGVGFDAADQADVSAEAGPFEATLDAGISHETEQTSYLFLDGRGSGEGQVIFPGENRSMHGNGSVALSSPRAGQTGFDVQRWTGEPLWFLTDAWLPYSDA